MPDEIMETNKKQSTWVGIEFVGKKGFNHYFELTCPCGETMKFGLNNVPTQTTQFPCNNPEHFAVKFTEESE